MYAHISIMNNTTTTTTICLQPAPSPGNIRWSPQEFDFNEL